MKRKNLFLLCSLLLFFSSIYLYYPKLKKLVSPNNEAKITTVISSIPQEDQKRLKHFFQYLLFHERFAYTLFCDKPLSLSICPELTQHTKDDTLPYLTKRDWQTWEKYAHLFPMRNFVLRKLTSEKKSDAVILLINKKEFLKVVSKNQKFFRTTLSSEITPKQLLHTFLTHPRPFKKGLHNRSILKGILSGFGKNNASLYQRRKNIEYALVGSVNRPYLKPRAPFRSLEEEFHHLTQQLRPFSPKDSQSLRLPSFYADPTTDETQRLKTKYNSQRNFLISHLNQDNFLSLTLTKLTSN